MRTRRWLGEASFPGKDAFVLGTVEAETELEAERKMFDLWERLMPYDPPRTFVLIPGFMVIHRESDDD